MQSVNMQAKKGSRVVNCMQHQCPDEVRERHLQRECEHSSAIMSTWEQQWEHR